MFAVWLKNHTSTQALGNVTPFKKLYSKKPNLRSVPEWGQHIWVHNDKGSKLDTRATEGRWVGFDRESTHAHCIYWPDKRHVSVERNIKFVSATVTVYSPCPSIPLATPQPQEQKAPQSVTPIRCVTTLKPPSIPTSTSAPQTPHLFATDSGEEEMPEKEDDIVSPPTSVPAPFLASTPAPPSRPTIGSLLKQKTLVQPSGAPKKSKTGQQAKPTRHSRHITQQTANHTMGDGTTSASKSNTPRGSSVFHGYHPNYVEPDVMNEAALLVQLEEQMEDDYGDDEYDTYNMLDLYDIIASAIQETQSDPKTLQEVQSHVDWP